MASDNNYTNTNKEERQEGRRNKSPIALIIGIILLLLIGLGGLIIQVIVGGSGRDSSAVVSEVTEMTETSETGEITETGETSENSEISVSSETAQNSETAGTSESGASENSYASNKPSESETPASGEVTSETISWDASWEYADFSKVHDSSVTLYRSGSADRKDTIVAVNAGHGSKAAWNVETLCHPDGSPKVTGGSTKEGETTAKGASSGTVLDDGTSEADANLAMAIILKDTLLENGYDVLMIRETEDCDLDNVARTVYSNNNADCHIAIHYDSSENDKGLFYCSVPDVDSYRSMEPVASHYEEHLAFGDALIAGEKEEGIKIYNDGSMAVDLTQTSYSTIPSVDLEIGDRASAHDESYHQTVANGIVKGLDLYFNRN